MALPNTAHCPSQEWERHYAMMEEGATVEELVSIVAVAYAALRREIGGAPVIEIRARMKELGIDIDAALAKVES